MSEPDYSGMFYDRDGNDIGPDEHAELFAGPAGMAYRRVADDVVGVWWVSTICTGLNAGLPWEPPLIFETKTFVAATRGTGQPQEVIGVNGFDRYSTLEEAEAGHRQIVERLRKRVG